MRQKLKTRSSAAKRYRKTRTGKVVRRMAYKGHILEKKSAKRKRNLRTTALVFKGELRAIRLMLPNK
jgi:large subunit ribosomal protein L35